MPRYIDADELLTDKNQHYDWLSDEHYVRVRTIELMPTADVAKQKKGEWVRDEFGSKCSCCGLYAYRNRFGLPWESDFCPNCGADMRGEQDAETN